MTKERGEIIEIGCDWLTATVTTTDKTPLEQSALHVTVAKWENRAKALLGNLEPQPWQSHGYDGFKGQHFEFGTRTDGCIIRLHGPLAATDWKGFARQATNISRFDLQATVKFELDLEGLAQDEKTKAKLHRENSRYKYQINLHDGCGDGDTLYLGSRNSEKFGRLYDKFRESKNPEYSNCWRYEIEYADKVAVLVARFLLASDGNPTAMLPPLVEQFAFWGIITPFHSTSPIPDLRVKRKQPTDFGTLSWLKDSVRPAIEKLTAKGFEAEVMVALFGIGTDDGSEGETAIHL